MNSEVSFDVISDLYLSPDDSFNWANKATSLYCIVAGNVSSDLRTIVQTLAHLGRFYQGVFYVPGTLEYENAENILDRTDEIKSIVNQIPNVCLLYQNVATIDGVAVLGANGWCDTGDTYTVDKLYETACRHDDIIYLRRSLNKLQRHLDIKKIVMVTNAVPHASLYFGETPIITEDQTPICDTLDSDTERKVSHWVFGNYEKNVEKTIDDINFVNNPGLHQTPYWPKRITLSV